MLLVLGALVFVLVIFVLLGITLLRSRNFRQVEEHDVGRKSEPRA
jgi:hypothetical protein